MKKNRIWKKFSNGVLAVACMSVAALTSCSKTDMDKPQTTQEAGGISSGSQFVPDQYIVTLKDNTAPSSNPLEVAKAGEDLISKAFSKQISIGSENAFSSIRQGFVVRLTKDQADALRNNPGVASVEQDQLITFGNPHKTTTTGSTSTSGSTTTTTTKIDSSNQPAQVIPWGVAAVGAKSAVGKTAWIIDSGLDPNHPDLNVDASRSRSFLTSSFGGNWSSWADEYGHGTMVGGIIGAKNNSYGVEGVAPGATLVSLKVINYAGQGYGSGLIQALNYVYSYGKPGDVVNISLGMAANSTVDYYVAKVASRGIFVAIAAGNSNADCSNVSPARCNATNVFTASASKSDKSWWSGSNYGSPVDYSLPGYNIYTTTMGGGYGTGSGTSFASPHLAGIMLANGGSVNKNGYVTSDPDNTADPLAHD